MSFPNTLPSIDSNAHIGATDIYTKYSTDADYAYYDAWLISANRYRLNNRDWSIKIGINPSNSDYKEILDHGSGHPTIIAKDSNGVVTLSDTNIPNWYKFDDPNFTSGPTVTSITVANQNSGTRTFTVTHTGTLTASDIGYKIDGVDITSLGSPNTPITNLQTTATGSTFNSYTLSSNGYHLINIGTQYLEFYRSSTYLVQNSFPD